MFDIHNILKYSLVIILVSLSLIATACKESNPTTPVTPHFEAEGVVITSSGIEVARIYHGITADTLHVPLGALTDHFKMYFLDADTNRLDPPTDADHHLAWVFDDPSIAEVYQDPGQEGSFELHLRGLKAGATMVEFFIQHVDHSDYRSGKFPVVVEDQGNADPDHIELRDEATGAVLIWSSLASNHSVTGSFAFSPGDTTRDMKIAFFTASNQEFTPNAQTSSVELTASDPGVFGITGPTVEEPFTFSVYAKSVGTATLGIKYLRGGSTVAEFTPVPVTVEP